MSENTETSIYKHKLKKFSKNHAVDECRDRVCFWNNQNKISGDTKTFLMGYIDDVLFEKFL